MSRGHGWLPQVRWVSRERTSPLQDYTNMTLASFDTLANFFSAFATAGLGSPLRPRTYLARALPRIFLDR
jgi:hypothetical protein